MSETTAKLNIEGTGDSIDVTRRNATLFTFLGETAHLGSMVEAETFNHVYITFESEHTGRREAVYIFEHSPLRDAYTRLAEFMIEHQYPAMLNFPEVPEADKQSWSRVNGVTVDMVPDFVPDDL